MNSVIKLTKVIRLVSLYHASLGLALTSSEDPSFPSHSCSHNAHQMLVQRCNNLGGQAPSVLLMARSLGPNTVLDNAGLFNKYQITKLTQKGCRINQLVNYSWIILSRWLFKSKTKWKVEVWACQE